MNAPLTMADVTAPKSDQWNADDFISGPRTFTIREVQLRGGQEQPVNVLLDGTDKAYRPCKGMARVMMQAWGPDAKAYVGKSLTLYRDPTVTWAGIAVGGIRISHMSHLDRMMLAAVKVSRGQVKPKEILPLVMDKPRGPASGFDAMLRAITACNSQPDLRKWWKDNGDTIADADYDRTFQAFNARLAEIKAVASTSSPAQGSTRGEDGAADPPQGRGDEDPFRTAADRLIAMARNGKVFSEKDALDLAALPDEMRAEVDAACETA